MLPGQLSFVYWPITIFPLVCAITTINESSSTIFIRNITCGVCASFTCAVGAVSTYARQDTRACITDEYRVAVLFERSFKQD